VEAEESLDAALKQLLFICSQPLARSLAARLLMKEETAKAKTGVKALEAMQSAAMSTQIPADGDCLLNPSLSLLTVHLQSREGASYTFHCLSEPMYTTSYQIVGSLSVFIPA
jgi:hypothetical protein